MARGQACRETRPAIVGKVAVGESHNAPFLLLPRNLRDDPHIPKTPTGPRTLGITLTRSWLSASIHGGQRAYQEWWRDRPCEAAATDAFGANA